MDWRLYTPSDHDMVAGWWRGWNWPVIPPRALPRIGVIVCKGELPIAAMWLYQSDCCVAMIGFFITNPTATAREHQEALDTGISTLTGIADDLGYTTIFATVTKSGLAKALQKQGFGYREKATNLYRIIENG